MSVQMPMYLARSLLKNVSTTTTLPMAAGGQMKKAQKARQVAVAANVFVLAQAQLKTRAPIKEMMKMGLRPKRVERGLQNNGAPPMMAIWRDVRYEVWCMVTPRSSAISPYAELMPAAMKVAIMAWKATRTRFVTFCYS